MKKDTDPQCIRELCSILDYSAALLPEATEEMVRKACADAKRYRFAAVPVFSNYIKTVAGQLAGTGIAVELTVGFPSGGVGTALKIRETELGIEDGATEVDMVMNIGRLIAKDFAFVEQDIQAVVVAAKQASVGVKVIIETGYLSDEQKLDALKIICNSGAEFVKTCTGFAPGKATLHDIVLLKQHAGTVKVKASGGVSSLEDAFCFREAGADRIAGRYPFVRQLEELGITSFD